MGKVVRLAEILGALSRALDLTEGQPPGHCVRCCWIGIHVGRAMGMTEHQLRELYYALLLKDLGCSSNAARICELYLADDISFKNDFKLLDGSLPQVLRFVLSHTGANTHLAQRFRSIMAILQSGGKIARELIETRCQRGAEIALQMRFSDAVANGILDLDEHWDGGGKPHGKAAADISPFARIALLAQVADVFHAASGRAAAYSEIGNRSGSWFDPAAVAAFQAVAADDAFWSMLASPDIEQVVFDMEPGQSVALADEDYLDDIAGAFARVIDAKSPFTSGHSERVAVFADLIAEEMDFDDGRRRWLKRAALLHDIGKLGVSNCVLDKPGKLDDAEWVAMKRHAELSEAILSRIAAFADLSKVAGAHHERLDGKGYPKGLAGDEIDLETRIVSTADVFDALTADRPYRAAMPVAKALVILRQGAGASHDALCIDALDRALRKAEISEAA
ncbi:HD-GYP domain-containing protein [Mesorhizobium marinum]|uniref:HD-GYP domain-containing protein n=1 Tax=Mesorhizobium marinum TaxID=3228790 RepID=UPI003467D71D